MMIITIYQTFLDVHEYLRDRSLIKVRAGGYKTVGGGGGGTSQVLPLQKVCVAENVLATLKYVCVGRGSCRKSFQVILMWVLEVLN